MTATFTKPSHEMRAIDGIAHTLLRQVDNLEGHCSVLSQLGAASPKATVTAADMGRQASLIADNLREIRAGLEQILSYGRG